MDNPMTPWCHESILCHFYINEVLGCVKWFKHVSIVCPNSEHLTVWRMRYWKPCEMQIKELLLVNGIVGHNTFIILCVIIILCVRQKPIILFAFVFVICCLCILVHSCTCIVVEIKKRNSIFQATFPDGWKYFYTDMNNCVTNNGHVTEYFKLEQGVR